MVISIINFRKRVGLESFIKKLRNVIRRKVCQDVLTVVGLKEKWY